MYSIRVVKSYNVLCKCLVQYFSKVINNLVYSVSPLWGSKIEKGSEVQRSFKRDDTFLMASCGEVIIFPFKISAMNKGL